MPLLLRVREPSSDLGQQLESWILLKVGYSFAKRHIVLRCSDRTGARRGCYDLDIGMVITEPMSPIPDLRVMVNNRYDPLCTNERPGTLRTMFMHFLYFSDLNEFFVRGGRSGQAFPNLQYSQSCSAIKTYVKHKLSGHDMPRQPGANRMYHDWPNA